MPDRNRCQWLIAAELEHELPREAAEAMAARIVAALDAAVEEAGGPAFAEGDLVQVAEGISAGICLVGLNVGPEGVEAYKPGPLSDMGFLYQPGELVHTGGVAGLPRYQGEGGEHAVR